MLAPTPHYTTPRHLIHYNDDLQRGRGWFFPAVVVLVELRVRRSWGGGVAGVLGMGREREETS